ncbi:MAG: glycosyltransferase [Planctomycetaceae bacterium]
MSMISAVNSAPARSDATRPVSVVHLVLNLNIGGLERVVYDLVRCADRERFTVQVLCLGETGPLGSAIEELGITVESLDIYRKGPLAAVIALARRLRTLRPDVLHTHNAVPHLIGAPAARLSGVPTVVHTRHGRHLYQGWKTGLMNRLACRLTNRMVAVSSDAAEVSCNHDGVSRHSVDVIWNGIDVSQFPLRAQTASAASRRAIHVSRLADDIKDQRTLLRAARIVADAEPEFILDIVGDGPDRAPLEALSEELSLQSHVRFLGYRRDVRDLLSDADVFVLSSLTEGLSISILEAMAVGLPVVATNVGGNPEVVVEEETGLLVPARSPEELASALLRVFRQPNWGAQLGAAGRRRVEQHFDLRQVAAKYEELYLRLISG